MAVGLAENWRNQWVEKDAAHTFNFTLIDDSDGTAFNYASGKSATISITKPGGAALETAVSGVALTWTSGNALSYTLAAGNTATKAQGYRGVLAITDTDGTVYSIPFFFDIVPFVLVITIQNSDITDVYPDSTNWYPSGQTSWWTQILVAWKEVLRDIRSMVTRLPDIAVDPQTLRELHIEASFAVIFRQLWKEEADPFHSKLLWHEDRYQMRLKSLRDVRDVNLSGHVDSDQDRLEPRPIGGLLSRG